MKEWCSDCGRFQRALIVACDPSRTGATSDMVFGVKPADLEAHLAGTVLRWIAEKGFVPIQEFVTPWGKADVLAIKPNIDRVKTRIDARQCEPIGDVHTMQLLLNIPSAGRPKRVAELGRRFEPVFGAQLFSKAIQTLLKKKFVSLEGGGLVRRVEWIPYHEQLMVVELKLKRVEEALAQARRHKAITDQSYVGMPAVMAERIVSTDKRGDFEHAGVGLLAIEGDVCEEVIEPDLSCSGVIEAQQLSAAESCWRSVLKTIQH